MLNERGLITQHLQEIIREQIPADDLYAIFNHEPNVCISVKDQNQGYLYSNSTNLTLMGYPDLKSFLHKKDSEITSDKKLLKLINELDDYVYSTENSLDIEGDVRPDNHPNLVKAMAGKQFPLHINSNKANALLLIVRPKNNIITLNLQHFITCTSSQLQEYLTRTSYIVPFNDFELRLSRMELLCFAEMLKGKHAGEIAEVFDIKQVTVESYLSHLRVKCCVKNRSDLIEFFSIHKILENILV